jgi:hypothetical protein
MPPAREEAASVSAFVTVVFANDAIQTLPVGRPCKLMQMDGTQLHRRRRTIQFILVFCALAVIFALDYLLLMHSIPS